jgi:uncharacterized tellurite resistance protein B-like protein
MIKRLSEKLSKALAATDAATPDENEREQAIRMATAVLMTEVARADFQYDEAELDVLLQLITNTFQMSVEDAVELANEAANTAEDYVALHGFTQLLNESLSEPEKEHIVSLLWQVAYADGRLDRYEDSLVSKIGALLYVSRSRVMRLKHDANQANFDNR